MLQKLGVPGEALKPAALTLASYSQGPGIRCFLRHDESPEFSSNKTDNTVQMELLASVMGL
jgi:hypothetical protein